MQCKATSHEEVLTETVPHLLQYIYILIYADAVSTCLIMSLYISTPDYHVATIIRTTSLQPRLARIVPYTVRRSWLPESPSLDISANSSSNSSANLAGKLHKVACGQKADLSKAPEGKLRQVAPEAPWHCPPNPQSFGGLR